MGLDTSEQYQRNYLIGNCKHRPVARVWHDNPELRQRLGIEDNHYDDLIPHSEVVRRLFNWKPLGVPKANLIPCSKKDANYFVEKEVMDPKTEKMVKVSLPHRISMSEDEQGIVRSDTVENIATHSSSYRIHDYEDWLIRLQAKIIGTSELSILGAGLPRGGAQAYVQIALPDTVKDDKTDVEFFPYILGSTSLDGSLPTTFGRGSLLVVCDNTRNMALRQQYNSGQIYKARHTSRSLDTDRIKDARAALRIVHQQAEGMIAEVHELAAISMNKRQIAKTFDIIMPIPEVGDASSKAITMAKNRRDSLLEVYFDRGPTKGMMASQQGTALGVVQAVNTWATHISTVHGNRFARNVDRMLKGKFDDFDKRSVAAIATVMNKPELLSAS